MIAGLAITAFAAGCGTSGDGGGGSDSAGLPGAEVAARYGYDIESAVETPVYQLVPEFHDPDEIYARMLLLKECLRDVVEFRVQPPDRDLAAQPINPRTAQRNFNEQVAAQWGYQLPAPPSSGNQGVPEGVEITPVIDQKMLACGDEIAKDLGSPPEKPLAAIETAGWDAVETSEDLRRAAEAWKECMSPAGVIDLPDSPRDMPSPSVGAANPGPGVTTPGATAATARERAVAVADARCQEEVGFPRAETRARAEAELAAIGRDLQGFEAARQEYAEYDDKIDRVIQELGG